MTSELRSATRKSGVFFLRSRAMPEPSPPWDEVSQANGVGAWGSGKQRERSCVTWAHDAEVPAVERGDLCCSKPFGDCDDRGIDHTKGKIRVGGDQLGGSPVVTTLEVDHAQLAVGDRGEQLSFEVDRDVTPNNPADFDHDPRRNHELFTTLLEELHASMVMTVVCVSSGDEDAAVNDDHEPSSALRISSTCSERS